MPVSESSNTVNDQLSHVGPYLKIKALGVETYLDWVLNQTSQTNQMSDK